MARSLTVAHERPILFSAPMVRAILDGRKTQTRRVFVPPPPFAPGDDIDVQLATGSIAPRFAVGDRLWVRETWSGPYRMGDIPPRDWLPGLPIWYWADGAPAAGDWTKPKPSIHMPRWASRITLEVTEVRVQRLQDISKEDARAEGASLDMIYERESPSFRAGFQVLWTSIHGPGSWDANPWVTAITFRRIDQAGGQHG